MSLALTTSYQLVSSTACFIQPTDNFLFGFKSSTPSNVFKFNLTSASQTMSYDGSLGALYAKLTSSSSTCTLTVESE